jgi:eukaryotic-like serine/threonine-protein kinase
MSSNKDENYGRLIVQRYQLLEIAGKGSMGQVYLAKDMLLGGVKVAVKFLSKASITQKIRDRFMQEATISALLGENSIHIVKVRDYGLDETEMPFYVMEFLQGDSLKDVIHKKPMPLPRFFNVLRQICLGLDCAHEGIEIDGNLCQVIHRDIKPSNIIVTQNPTIGDFVKVLDFGIALLQSDDSPTGFMGTPAYCSPEQMEGKVLDNRSDIYSLGIMMFQMLTGELPLRPPTSSFEGWFNVHHKVAPRTFKEACPQLDLPSEIEALVMSCMAKSVKDRPQNVEEILTVIEHLESTYISGTTTSGGKRPSKSSGKISNLDELCLQSTWPTDKPRAEIVFPRLMEYESEVSATLWIMLSREEINYYKKQPPHCQFLFLASPHPMLLWIAALYHNEQQHRLLPSYLDLKKQTSERTLSVLAKTQSYRLLFFGLEGDSNCISLIKGKIPSTKVLKLEEWLQESQATPGSNEQKASRSYLKEEFEAVKPKLISSLSRKQRKNQVSSSP